MKGVARASFNMKKNIQDIDWHGKKVKRQSIKGHVRRFLLYPPFWKDSTKRISPGIKWKKVKFISTNIPRVPTSHGIYCFVMIPPKPNNFWTTRYLFYIGKAASASLRERYKNYLNEKKGLGIGRQKARIKVEEMLNDFDGYMYFFYSEILETREIVEIEEKLLNTYMPYVNTSIPEAKISEELKHIY